MGVRQPIVIVGAGVIGLSTAVILQQRKASSDIIIVAAEVPPPAKSPSNSSQKLSRVDASPDYASMWAGAHYRPTPGSTAQLKSETELCVLTARVMRQIARKHPQAGVQMMQGVEYFDDPSDDVLKADHPLTGWQRDGSRILNASELPAGVKHGIEYQTYCLNPPVYTRWLLDRFTANGGKTVQRKLTTVADAFDLGAEEHSGDKKPLVINCSGRNFDQDPRTNIIRGQTVLVRNQYHRTITRQYRDGKWTFLIPRPLGGGTIVGGTKEIGDIETEPRLSTREDLLKRATESFPDFVKDPKDFDIVHDVVGRRPWREGGMRMEVESLSNGGTIIHGYGAGGRGHEMSWGVAAGISRLLKEFESQSSKL